MSKQLGTDKDGFQKVMTPKDYAGDAAGQVTLNTINALNGQMTYFYTTKVGMNSVTAGNVLLIARLVDGISDIIMGRIVDKTNTKDGKAMAEMDDHPDRSLYDPSFHDSAGE